MAIHMLPESFSEKKELKRIAQVTIIANVDEDVWYRRYEAILAENRRTLAENKRVLAEKDRALEALKREIQELKLRYGIV